MKTALETVCDALNDKGTQFLLIGGFALAQTCQQYGPTGIFEKLQDYL